MEQQRSGTRITRRAFVIGGVAAAGGVAAVTAGVIAQRDSSDPFALRWRGVNLDLDRDLLRRDFVGQELTAIADDLHANAVLLLGSDVEALADSAAMAADRGLHVWLEPRHFESDAVDTLAFVTEVAVAAEALRRDGADIGLSMGVELTLFMQGLLPGDGWLERGQGIASVDPDHYNGRLNEYLASALEGIRPVFGGRLTYSSGPWETVDWAGFDVVGVDLYRTADNRATYVEDLRGYLAHGKPVMITEFGCCTFAGAAELGGEGFMVTMDGDRSGLVRDEQEQADEIAELLDLYAAEGVHGAFVYNFIEPANTYSTDPADDLDMTGFSLVKCYAAGSDKAYETTGYFEPKTSFRAVASRYARPLP